MLHTLRLRAHPGLLHWRGKELHEVHWSQHVQLEHIVPDRRVACMRHSRFKHSTDISEGSPVHLLQSPTQSKLSEVRHNQGLATGMQLYLGSFEGSLTFNRAWSLLHATACIVHQHMHHAVLPKHIFGKFGGRFNIRKILQSRSGLIRVLLHHCKAELHLCSYFA